jgi:hypothetical protein
MTPLRARLFRPDNAVPDTGFHFKNGKPVKASGSLVQRSFEARALQAALPVTAFPAGFSAHDRVIKTVCKVFSLQPNELLSERRNIWVAEARQVAIALTVRLTKNSLSKVGTIFNRDRTTVLHAVRKMQPHIAAIDAHMPPESLLEWATALKEWVADPKVVEARKARHYAGRLASATHCLNGHPYDEQNTIIRRDNGTRRCRACANRRHRLRYQKKMARLEA